MIIHYPCPECGAEMTYDIKKSKLCCSHCGHTLVPEEVQPQGGAAEDEAEIPEGETYACPNCGGVFITEEKETSTLCAYCGTPMILADRFSGKRRPARILPFRMNRADAEDAFRKWCRNGLFAPKGFVSAKNIQRLKAMYVPYWLFHFDTQAEAFAKATNIHIFRQGDYEITETEFFDIHRAYQLRYENIPYDASAKLDDGEMAKLEPFNFDGLKAFSMPYLAGFESSGYDFDDEALAPAVKDKVTHYAEDYIRGAVSGYTTVTIQEKRVDFTREAGEFIYVPVWFVAYNYRETVYKFMMNGQNGRVAGKPPLSRAKMNLWWAGISGALFLAALAGSFLI